MNIAGMIYESLNDGEGYRTVIFISGCHHHCLGCHNERINDPDYGIPFTTDLQQFVIDYMGENDMVTGLTVSGGDPLNQADHLLPFLRRAKRELPDLDIWVYTGYTFEEVKNWPVMRFIDVLVDGKFEIDKRDITLPFKGSSNQRAIDVRKSLEAGTVVLHKMRIEDEII